MGYLSDYNQKNGIETPSSTGSTGFLQQYNSQPHPTTTPIAKPKATTPVKITQPQTQTPAKPGLLQQAENFIAPVIKTVEKAPIIGKPLQEAVATAKEVVKETPAVIKAVKADAKSTVKHPVETAAGFTLGVGKALTDFSISTQKTINNIKNGIDTAVYNAVGYKPPKNWDPRENRDNMVKILEGFQKTRDQNFSIMGKDTNRGIAIGNFIGSFIPYAVAAEAATIAVGSALITPTITKFAPNAIKLAPTIGNAVSFLGLGQLTFDKTVDKSRVEKAKNDLIMLGVFEAGGYIAKELSSATKNLISKVVNLASKQIKSPKGADLNSLETQINEVKDAVKKDTGKNAETVLARNMANASDSQIKIVNGKEFGFKEQTNNFTYEPAKNLSPEHKKIETQFAQEISNNLEGTIKKYKEVNGNILNTDRARELSSHYSASNEARSQYSAAVHEPASSLIKVMYKQELAKPAPEGKYNAVLFTGGGTGAGKSRALENIIDPKKYQIVYDTNLNSFKSADSKIQQALKAGKSVDISYIYRDPIEAMQNGALTRAMREGRTVPIVNHIDTHQGVIATSKQLVEKYKNDPRVNINFIDNSLGKGKQKLTTIDVFKKNNYNESVLKQKLQEVVNNEYKNGKISKPVHEGTIGTKAPEPITGKTNSASDGKQPQKNLKPKEVTKVETVTKETNKKAPFSSKEAKATQQTFSDELNTIATTAKNEAELTSRTEKAINDVIEKVKGDRSGLAGVRTSIVKQMNDLAGVTPGASFKQQYAELQMMLKEGSGVDKILNLLEDKKIQIDELIKSTPETTKTITRTVEKRITEKPIQQPIGKGEQRVSRLAAGVEAKTVEKKLTDSLGSLPEYRQVDMKEQSTMATDLLAKDPEKAIDIALGKRTPPANILPESVFVAVENKALSEGNIDLLKQLASSVRVGEATAMGQRIRALAERNADSPIGAMKDVIDARVKATEARFKKSVSQAIKDETARIKAKVKVPDKYDWNAFVESIKC